MQRKYFEIADQMCKEATLGFKDTKDVNNWIKDHQSLFESVTVFNSKKEFELNMLFEGKFYLNIGSFFDIYKGILFEQNILDHLSQEQAVIYFFEKMDIAKLDSLLDDDLTYQDIKKSQYMIVLNNAFEEMKKRKNTHLISYPGKCQGCKPGHKSYCFIGNQDGSHIDILIEMDPCSKRIKDIYECLKMSYNELKQPVFEKHIRIHTFEFKD
jgi:hypothetical protein